MLNLLSKREDAGRVATEGRKFVHEVCGIHRKSQKAAMDHAVAVVYAVAVSLTARTLTSSGLGAQAGPPAAGGCRPVHPARGGHGAPAPHQRRPPRAAGAVAGPGSRSCHAPAPLVLTRCGVFVSFGALHMPATDICLSKALHCVLPRHTLPFLFKPSCFLRDEELHRRFDDIQLSPCDALYKSSPAHDRSCKPYI